jgi:hypothetical protein
MVHEKIQSQCRDDIVIFEHWGSTPEEIASSVVGDDLCPDARLVATRSITIAAPPENVFPWIRQMGFKRAGWYSYDLIDNLGRKSATAIHDEWQDVIEGSSVPAGLMAFTAAVVEPPRAFVLQVDSKKRTTQRLCFTLAYELRDHPTGTRLVTRMRAQINLPGGRFIERVLLGPGDGIMLRKQLLNIANRSLQSNS